MDNYFIKCHNNIYMTNYFEERGISQNTVERFNIGYDNNCDLFNGAPAIIIPTGEETYIARKREVINIRELNKELAQIVARENELRAEIDKIIAEIEGC